MLRGAPGRQLRFLDGKILPWLALAVLALSCSACGKVDLYSRLDEQEANEMTTILAANGIQATKSTGADNTFMLSVRQDDFAEAVDLLRNSGYPRGQFVSMGDVFKQSGMVSSPTEDRIRFMYALSQSLSETITQIDGVVTARVHIVLPDTKPLTDTTYPASAAVFVKVRPDSSVGDLRPQIKHLVANSIQGLTYQNVSLVVVPAVELEPLSAVMPRKPNDTVWVVGGGFAFLALMSLGAYVWFARKRKTAPDETAKGKAGKESARKS